jgi:two-component system, LytTR family, sensor histidine kinase AlgZ
MIPRSGEEMADHSTQSDAPDDVDSARHLVVPYLCTVPSITLLVLVGEMLALVLMFAGGGVSWARFALLSLFVQWVALLSAGALCLLRPRLMAMSLPAGALVALGAVLGITFAVGLAADRVTAQVLTGVSVDWAAISSQQVIAGIICVLALRYFHVQQQLRLREQAELKSRLQALQSRIRPHFLFNSMNIIASLIATDPETAEAVVEDLSELFRASLNEAGHEVPLADELELCERYARIEGLRLGDRLAIEWDVAQIPDGVRIPLLTLQPLLENAIYHGIQPLPEGGTVGIRIHFDDDAVHVEISNPLPRDMGDSGVRWSGSKGNRMALDNIRRRLAALHGDGARLDAGSVGARSVTTLRYPR